MRTILRATAAAIVVAGLSIPAQADEIEESLQLALEAYQAGDINAAKEEIDYISQLLAQMKAAGLGGFLPDALPDWTRAADDQGNQATVAFGGGVSAGATYTRGNERVEIQLMADNQMVTAMAGMFSNTAMLGSMGQVKRIKRQKVVVTKQGELQALINNRIYVQVKGNASIEDKEAYFGALDLRGLKDF